MLPVFSRENPSPRYTELLAQYRSMHVAGEVASGLPASQTFPGKSLLPQVRSITGLIEATSAKSILDYGCGKGLQYRPAPLKVEGAGTFACVQDYWDVDLIYCYDPGYQPYSTRPAGQFDGVICTDVLEHCPEPDLPWIVGELFAYARRFVFVSIAVYPATKHLPNGENAHATVRDDAWWQRLFDDVAAGYPGLRWEGRVEHRDPQPNGKFMRRETAIRGPQPAV